MTTHTVETHGGRSLTNTFHDFDVRGLEVWAKHVGSNDKDTKHHYICEAPIGRLFEVALREGEHKVWSVSTTYYCKVSSDPKEGNSIKDDNGCSVEGNFTINANNRNATGDL